MISSFLYNIIFRKWRTLIIVGLFSLIIQISVNVDKFLHPYSVEHLLELHKCPACYGVSACSYIQNIDITPQDIFSIFSYIFNVKNVYFGLYKETQVILKKLAHTSELEAFDQMLCENKNLHLCDQTLKINSYNTNKIDFLELIEKEITLHFTDVKSRLRLCPNVEHLNDLFQNIYDNNSNVEHLINLWTLITINPEPLVLQILPAAQGWPLPKYLGACGRIIVEEYVGLPIAAYYDKPWVYRARIASSLLDAAHMFTFGDKRFGFYLTDLSADNIAIDLYGSAKFIDVEHIIIVDKYASLHDKSTRWQEVQKNTLDFDCSDCFAFSPIDICSHQISDHNYYAICQLLLSPKAGDKAISGGFLHHIPPDISKMYSNLSYLIQQCTIPDESQSRISNGQQLKLLLDLILEKNVLT